MKKLLLLFTITLMVSCKPETPVVEQPQNYTNWEVEVKYLDKTVDTIVIRSVNAPFLWIDDHVSVVRLDDSYVPYASYVKTIKILNQK